MATTNKRTAMQRTTKVWQAVRPIAIRLGSLMLVSAIVIGAWLQFFAIVAPPPIETTPALIMIWASAALLLLALFPRMLDRIKRIKISDFELEFQDAVAKATAKDSTLVPRVEEQTFAQKGTFDDLASILREVERSPSKPVLLHVNIDRDDLVSIPMLFIYLFVLDLVGSSTIVLFVRSGRLNRTSSGIFADEIVGAVPGKTVMRVFLERVPALYRIYGSNAVRVFSENRMNPDGAKIADLGSIFFRDFRGSILEDGTDRYLTVGQVQNWFRGDMSTQTIQKELSATDLQAIRDAIVRGDEYLLVLDAERLNAVITLCSLMSSVTTRLWDESVEK